ncbi:hypothetical protein FQN54_000783 [Arachnomyces sp. PD_36]|nr:hypothetical protein FQN54_000783 [Arachnomyces sp. PD_36]
MAPPKLSYGLNLPNKKPQGVSLQKPSLTGQKRKKTIFDSDSDSDDDNSKKNTAETASIEISTVGGLEPAPSDPKDSKPPPSQKPRLNTAPRNGSPAIDKPTKKSQSASTSQDGPSSYINLAALHTSKKNAQTATDLDPTIYSYDDIYDSIHTKPASKTNNNDSSNPEAPKYMTSLLRSADVRKRDQLRARDRLLAKEREAEGDEFADKEKFVTAAYKAQQEEVKKIEEEEARREEEEEERRKKGGGMVGFYKDMLDRGERRHEEAVKAAEEAVERKKRQMEEGVAVGVGEEEAKGGEEKEEEKTEAQIAAELKARGRNVVVNDEGQVVDKRQLLSAGLNVAPKAKKDQHAQPVRPKPATSRPLDTSRAEPGTSRAAQRARQTQMVAAQLEERARQESEAEEAKQKELAEKAKSKKTETDVSSAKERYLARKRERELEAAAKKKGGE